ncbi:PIR Superfamily Protein, partial [Plasmodium ovale curtisi]
VISVNDFPSTKFKSIWNDGICYDEVNSIIAQKKGITDAYSWVMSFKKKFKDNLENRQIEIKKHELEKRCRDLYYIIYDILHKLKNVIDYDDSLYNNISDTIKGHINSTFINLSYLSCLSVANKGDDYAHENINDRKYIDDLCEDVKYIENNIREINSSSQCKQIEKNILERKGNMQATLNSGKHSDIPKHYKFSSYDELDNIIRKINCTSDSKTEQIAFKGYSQETPQLSVEHIPMVVIFSLLGFLLACFFLYKFTPLGILLKIRIGKKIKLENNLSEELENEVSDETSEYVRNNLYNNKYNILYNTSGNA